MPCSCYVCINDASCKRIDPELQKAKWNRSHEPTLKAVQRLSMNGSPLWSMTTQLANFGCKKATLFIFLSFSPPVPTQI